jgi:hypothetical protein
MILKGSTFRFEYVGADDQRPGADQEFGLGRALAAGGAGNDDGGVLVS